MIRNPSSAVMSFVLVQAAITTVATRRADWVRRRRVGVEAA
jgi:hypothetical protein